MAAASKILNCFLSFVLLQLTLLLATVFMGDHHHGGSNTQNLFKNKNDIESWPAHHVEEPFLPSKRNSVFTRKPLMRGTLLSKIAKGDFKKIRYESAMHANFNRFQKFCHSKPCLVHLHIAKNGGTSLDTVVKRIAAETHRAFCGRQHFDWSLIDTLLPEENVAVVTMLRHPVSRAVSHFYFNKYQKFSSREFKATPLGTFLQDKTMMLNERGLWQDGQASVSWLTGTHIAGWVGCDPEDVEQKERKSVTNITGLLNVAADHLEKISWFGILEDLDRSMELLQHTFQLNEIPILPQSNQGKVQHPKPTEEELSALASLMPQDLWLYQYSLLLFEARWQAYKTGKPVQLPPRPSIPAQQSCMSTRFALNCTSGPYQGTFSVK